MSLFDNGKVLLWNILRRLEFPKKYFSSMHKVIRSYHHSWNAWWCVTLSLNLNTFPYRRHFCIFTIWNDIIHSMKKCIEIGWEGDVLSCLLQSRRMLIYGNSQLDEVSDGILWEFSTLIVHKLTSFLQHG
jgi:hypothetical protein